MSDDPSTLALRGIDPSFVRDMRTRITQLVLHEPTLIAGETPEMADLRWLNEMLGPLEVILKEALAHVSPHSRGNFW